MDTTHPIDEARRAEYDALVTFMLEHAADADPQATAVAARIAAAALRDGHLWRAMGLADRGELRSLFETHFPALAAGNDRDMRWKKYLYKRLCGWPGFHG